MVKDYIRHTFNESYILMMKYSEEHVMGGFDE